MKTVVKIVAGLLVALLLVSVALSLFVRFYLTGEKIEALLLPPVRKALGREVTVGEISVSLLSGVTVRSFQVKEHDGKQDFLSVDAFVLRYDLMPLLRKEIVVSEIRLERPTLHVVRDEQGRFNFETLALLAAREPAQKGKGEEKTGSAVALPPLALTVEQIALHGARLHFEDLTGNLPQLEAGADLNIAIDLSGGFESLAFRGTGEYELKASSQEIAPRLSGTVRFDRQTLALSSRLEAQGEQMDVTVDVASLQPLKFTVDLASQRLSTDKWLAVVAALSGPEEKEAKETRSSAETKQVKGDAAIGDLLPNGLTAAGTVKVAKLIHENLEVDGLDCAWSLADKTLTVPACSLHVAQGTVATTTQVNLAERNPPFSGTFHLDALQLASLQRTFLPKLGERLSGNMDGDLRFSGTGFKWPLVRDSLSAEGSFRLENGRLEQTPLFAAVADILGLGELRNPNFSTYSGNLRIADGNLLLDSAMHGTHFDMQAKGAIGLDSTLNLPLRITLSPELTETARNKSSLTRYLTSQDGRATVALKMGGTLQKPRPALDSTAVQQQVKEIVLDKALRHLDGRSSEKKVDEPSSDRRENVKEDPKEAIKDVGRGLLKGLFSQ